MHTPARSLLPINYTSYVPPAVADNSTSAIDDAFLRMTMSSVPSGSKLLWCVGGWPWGCQQAPSRAAGRRC